MNRVTQIEEVVEAQIIRATRLIHRSSIKATLETLEIAQNLATTVEVEEMEALATELINNTQAMAM